MVGSICKTQHSNMVWIAGLVLHIQDKTKSPYWTKVQRDSISNFLTLSPLSIYVEILQPWACSPAAAAEKSNSFKYDEAHYCSTPPAIALSHVAGPLGLLYPSMANIETFLESSKLHSGFHFLESWSSSYLSGHWAFAFCIYYMITGTWC